MKTVKELVKGNIKDYEEFVGMLYEVQDITKVDMELAISILDEMYDLNCKLRSKEG